MKGRSFWKKMDSIILGSWSPTELVPGTLAHFCPHLPSPPSVPNPEVPGLWLAGADLAYRRRYGTLSLWPQLTKVHEHKDNRCPPG